MGKPFLRFGPSGRGEVFQPDKHSHRERMARLARSPWHALKIWWSTASSYERFERIWWWSFLGLMGFFVSACLVLAAAALAIVLI